jgi:hypothetical protein
LGNQGLFFLGEINMAQVVMIGRANLNTEQFSVAFASGVATTLPMNPGSANTRVPLGFLVNDVDFQIGTNISAWAMTLSATNVPIITLTFTGGGTRTFSVVIFYAE